jgi:putative two-component system response regulator
MSTAVSNLTVNTADQLPPVVLTGGNYRTAAAAESKVMVVDDEATNIKVVKRLLELEGYSRFITTTDATTAITLLRDEQPDILLLDLMMPHVSGLDILQQVRADDELSFIPIVILTAVTDRETKLQALQLGATDFLGKPLDPSELAARVRNVLAVQAYQNRLRHYSKDLESAVRERTAELEASRRDVIHCLARAAEYRDDDTGFHIIRVGKFVHLIAIALGMSNENAEVLEQASQLHDVGKIGVPDEILLKPGKLTSDEFNRMQKHCGFGKYILHPASIEEERVIKRHTEVGARILGSGTSPVLALAEKIALTHHEWWDGSGYPFKLKGEDIPLEGRITAVADVFDALSAKRCYKDAMSLDQCLTIMQSERGTHFDPRLLDIFVGLRTEVANIQLSYADEG